MKIEDFGGTALSVIFVDHFLVTFEGGWRAKALISCGRGSKNQISAKFDFPSIFGEILGVILGAKSLQNATLTHCGGL